MVYAAPRSYWDTHIFLSSKVGLEMTVGKAYVHHKYANVNSTCCHFDLRNERSTPLLIPYFNTGLFFGQNKVLGKAEEATSRCAVINKLLEGCLNEKTQAVVLQRYLTMHATEIKRETASIARYSKPNGRTFRVPFQRNLFLPVALGGMGVLSPSTWKYYLPKICRDIAATKKAQMEYEDIVKVEGQLPLNNPYLMEKITMDNNPWDLKLRLDDESIYEVHLALRHLRLGSQGICTWYYRTTSDPLLVSH
jgi:hypothetical protein